LSAVSSFFTLGGNALTTVIFFLFITVICSNRVEYPYVFYCIFVFFLIIKIFFKSLSIGLVIFLAIRVCFCFANIKKEFELAMLFLLIRGIGLIINKY
jgi:hypothetical protein